MDEHSRRRALEYRTGNGLLRCFERIWRCDQPGLLRRRVVAGERTGRTRPAFSNVQDKSPLLAIVHETHRRNTSFSATMASICISTFPLCLRLAGALCAGRISAAISLARAAPRQLVSLAEQLHRTRRPHQLRPQFPRPDGRAIRSVLKRMMAVADLRQGFRRRPVRPFRTADEEAGFARPAGHGADVPILYTGRRRRRCCTSTAARLACHAAGHRGGRHRRCRRLQFGRVPEQSVALPGLRAGMLTAPRVALEPAPAWQPAQRRHRTNCRNGWLPRFGSADDGNDGKGRFRGLRVPSDLSTLWH